MGFFLIEYASLYLLISVRVSCRFLPTYFYIRQKQMENPESLFLKENQRTGIQKPTEQKKKSYC